ncbi:DUF4184 family protein [Nocardioides sp. HDW12B]|uniref:DUF4184 family protein n=1 Tax=Nocardioides sp. HDW12B TaxID=2714939 RepID=UPI00140CD87D|nr:DUF4184 family protein [Nocardioides sp. HDW12B]QIK67826.1 DUF4184 family protein [Nocardioides sp. HDW12B]
MPLTLSHPAAVLPLRRVPGLAALPAAALVIASMVPDLPMFVPGRGGYRLSHSLLGVVTVDVAVTLLLLLVWDRVLRDALVDLSPRVVRDRFPRRARLPRASWLLAPAAAALGALTHVTWDAFTHPGRWGVRQVAWLGQDHLGLAGHQWAQYASGVLGLGVVLAATGRHVATRPPRARTSPRLLPAAVLPTGAALVALVTVVVGAGRRDEGLHAVAFHGVVAGLQAALVLTAGLTLGWGLLELRRARAAARSDAGRPRHPGSARPPAGPAR